VSNDWVDRQTAPSPPAPLPALHRKYPRGANGARGGVMKLSLRTQINLGLLVALLLAGLPAR